MTARPSKGDLETTVPSVRRFEPAEWRLYRDLRLRALADAPDAFGSTLALEEGRSDSEWADRLRSRLAGGLDLPLLAEDEGRAAGIAWGRIDPAAPETAHLYQMWVAPESRGRGCGAMLLGAVIRWARGKNARRLLLDVTCGPSPANRLYARAGFVPAGEPEAIRPGAASLVQPMRLDL